MRQEIERIANLLPMQMGILYHTFQHKDNSLYFQQINLKIEGEIDFDIIEKSFNILIKKHEVLRSIFVFEKIEVPKQVFINNRKSKIGFYDISKDDNKNEIINTIKVKDIQKGFNLSKDILIRINIIKTDSEKFHMIFSFHHIILDGWSLGIILKDLFEIYLKTLKNENITINKITSKEYENWIENQDERKGLIYWKNILGNVSMPSKVPYYKEIYNFENENDVLTFSLSKEVSQGLKKIVSRHGLTMNSIFQCIWGILLGRYNGIDEAIFGTIVSCRKPFIKDIKEMTGLFINNIPIIIDFNNEDCFIKFVKKMNIRFLESEENSFLTLSKVQRTSQVKNGLYDNILAFENYPINKDLVNKNSFGFEIKSFDVYEKTNYNLNVVVVPNERLEIKILFNKKIYSHKNIENINNHINNIVTSILENEYIKIGLINHMNIKEENIILDFSQNDSNNNISKLTSTINNKIKLLNISMEELVEDGYNIYILGKKLSIQPIEMVGDVYLSIPEVKIKSIKEFNTKIFISKPDPFKKDFILLNIEECGYWDENKNLNILHNDEQSIIVKANKKNSTYIEMNEKEKALKKICEKVLSIKNINIDEDFLEIGGDSITIMRVCSLAYREDIIIEAQNFYKYRTIRKIIKHLNDKKVEGNQIIEPKRIVPKDNKNVLISGRTNSMGNILLTGVTGFVGSHLLENLIENTDANVYCLIRGVNIKEATDKFIDTIHFYFNDKYLKFINKRIFILNGDITKIGFDLDIQTYMKVGKIINTIFHVAAKVKFLGEFEEFTITNEIGTKKLVDFSLKYNIKLNHISSTSVSGHGLRQNSMNLELFEKDLDIGQNYKENPYVNSKYNAELIIRKGIEEGLVASVFRIGAITSRYSDGVYQKNCNENAFYSIIRYLINNRLIASCIENEYIEFTPVDLCCDAIVKISKYVESNGNTFHIKNPNEIKIIDFIQSMQDIFDKQYQVIDANNFQEYISEIKNNKLISKEDIKFAEDCFDFTKLFGKEYHVNINTQRTLAFLNKVDFKWEKISNDYIKKIISYLVKINYVKIDKT